MQDCLEGGGLSRQSEVDESLLLANTPNGRNLRRKLSREESPEASVSQSVLIRQDEKDFASHKANISFISGGFIKGSAADLGVFLLYKLVHNYTFGCLPWVLDLQKRNIKKKTTTTRRTSK